MQFSSFASFAPFHPSARGPGEPPGGQDEVASAHSPSPLLARRQQLKESIAGLRQEFADLTQQIDRATGQPATIPTLAPPSPPQLGLAGRRSFGASFCGPDSGVLPTPSPQEFTDLQRYNQAYACRVPWDPSGYHPPFPPRAGGEPLSLRFLDFDPRDFNGGWTEQSPLFFPIFRFGALDTRSQKDAEPAPRRQRSPTRNHLDAALDVEAGGGLNDSPYREAVKLYQQREVTREAMVALAKAAFDRRQQYEALTDAIDLMSLSPPDIISEPIPCASPGGAQGDQAYLKRLHAAAHPIPSPQQFAALYAYNHDFARRPPLERVLYEPPFPPGRLQLGTLEACATQPGPSPWARRPVLSLYGGMVPLEAASLATQLRRRLAPQDPGHDIDPAYPEAAQSYRRREEVRKLLESSQQQFVTVVDEIAAQEKELLLT